MRIKLENLTKRFGLVEAVSEVGLEIHDGEIFFLLGPSGCGKTTLLRCLAGFCDPDSGTICFDDRDVTRMPPHLRPTGMVFQNYALWPHLTVAENVAFGLTVPGRKIPKPERRARVDEALRLVRLDGLAARRPAALSGGQQQRVALARALVVRPGCLLLDEPLSNLDAKLRADMRLELRHLIKNSGLTAVYVTHDQKEALSMADRCAVLRNGRVEQVDAPRSLYERPINRFVAQFMGGANLLTGRLTALDGALALISTDCGEWRSRTIMGRPAVGDAVTLAIRPEAIRFNALLPSNNANVFSGFLADRVFLGEIEELWVELTGGVKLKGVGSGLAAFPPDANGKVTIEIATDDVVALNA